MSVRISDSVKDPEAAVAAPSLEDSSTFLEKALMLYMNKFFTVTATRPLEFSDLGTISKQDACATGSRYFNITCYFDNTCAYLKAYHIMCMLAIYTSKLYNMSI